MANRYRYPMVLATLTAAYSPYLVRRWLAREVQTGDRVWQLSLVGLGAN